jgi:hypothetical protein
MTLDTTTILIIITNEKENNPARTTFTSSYIQGGVNIFNKQEFLKKKALT